jgi:DNA repair protein RecO (recombination protein O)
MSDYIKTKGIVLRNIPYGDKNLISHIYTESHGRLSFFIYGGQTRKKKNIYLPLNEIELVFAYDKKHELQKIKEAYSSETFKFHYDIKKSPVVFLVSELLSNTLNYEIKDEKLFTFLEKSLNFFNDTEKISVFFSQFVVFFAFFLGILSKNEEEFDGFFDFESNTYELYKPMGNFYLDKEQTLYMGNLLDLMAYNNDLFLTADKRHDLIEKFLKFFKLKFGIKDIKSYELFKRMY